MNTVNQRGACLQEAATSLSPGTTSLSTAHIRAAGHESSLVRSSDLPTTVRAPPSCAVLPFQLQRCPSVLMLRSTFCASACSQQGFASGKRSCALLLSLLLCGFVLALLRVCCLVRSRSCAFTASVPCASLC
jgi:hypothetical protein